MEKVQRIAQHKHCIVCSKAILPEDKFCSSECETQFIRMTKRRKYMVYAMYGMIIVFVLLAVFLR